MKLNIWPSPSEGQHQKLCSGAPAVNQDLRSRQGWPDKKATVQLANQVKGFF